jgi:hypothetical protein
MTTDAASVTPPAGVDYPVRYSVDYPEGPRNRLTVLFRPIVIIPIVIILSLLSGGGGGGGAPRGEFRDDGAMMRADWGARSFLHLPWIGAMPGYGAATGYESMYGSMSGMMPGGAPAGMPGPAMMPGGAPGAPGAPGVEAAGRWEGRGVATGGGLVVLPTVLMLLFRRKYPKWWFDWNRELYRFGARVGSFLFLFRDEYPSTDEEQAVHLDIDYPDAQQLNRWLPLVKWLLAIPHYVVLVFLALGVVLAWIVSWLAILVTGRQPRGLFDYMVGVMRCGSRVSGYAFLLVTDRYPPFSLK